MAQSELLVSTGRNAPAGAGTTHYSLLVARNSAEVVAAQRLRYQVFVGEMGAKLPATGVDEDPFDAFCDHIVVRDDHSGQIVGSYRMLPPERAREAGGLYSDTEFDLGSLRGIRHSVVETGRSCVHPDHRSGGVVGLVWAGITRYMLLSGHRYVAGCASVPLDDGGALAAGVWDQVSARNYAPDGYRVTPLRPWNVAAASPRSGRCVLPPLLRGYLRLGAWVCGPPAHDPDFGVADFFVLLPMDRLDRRYLRYLLGEEG
jgi:putative hemolysin